MTWYQLNQEMRLVCGFWTILFFYIIISVCFAPQSVHRYEHDGLLWIYVCIRATTNRYYFISFISFHWFVFHTHGSQERKRSNDSNANNNQYTLTITSRHLHSHWKCQDRKSHVHGQLKMCCSRTHFAVTTVEKERPNELASVDEQERRFAFCRLNLYACNGGMDISRDTSTICVSVSGVRFFCILGK